jgi:hypothetical protein
MRFNYFRFYQTFNRLIARSFYLGLGYNLDYHFKIHDLALDTISAEKTLTDHYIYSVENGFNQDKYITSGLVLNALWDSRDHPITPRRGHYANLSMRVNPTFLGSNQASTRVALEYKAFFPMSKSNQNYVLGLFTWQSYLLGGSNLISHCHPSPGICITGLGVDISREGLEERISFIWNPSSDFPYLPVEFYLVLHFECNFS